MLLAGDDSAAPSRATTPTARTTRGSDGSTLLAVLLHQEPPEGVRDTVFIAVNTGRADRAVEPSAPPSGTHWRLSLDTGAATEPEALVPPGRVHGPAALRLAPTRRSP
ncbi:hypothetical protein [Streptomyces sp. CSDS2]|uniref:hypothetical protein n=1 Tax=Streptomyces sp. CSDS2 TaxID=3055051 RepID=UPI00339D4953